MPSRLREFRLPANRGRIHALSVLLSGHMHRWAHVSAGQTNKPPAPDLDPTPPDSDCVRVCSALTCPQPLTLKPDTRFHKPRL